MANLHYAWGWLAGRSHTLPQSFSDLYALAFAKTTSLVNFFLPFLSIFAVPLFGGSSATANFLFFSATWSALVLSYGLLKIEIYGTLVLRLVFFLFPALLMLVFDTSIPETSKKIKSRGDKHHPTRLEQHRLAKVVGTAVFNVLLAVAVQGSLEFLCSRVLHMQSLIKVSWGMLPFPWSIVRDLIWGFVVRGVVQYVVHRHFLHTYNSPLMTWHLKWQHSVVPFSLVAAYDHPAPYLLAQWMPTFLPAYLFRWHVLTWFIFVALTSLEELFIYSGYSSLPSNIILPGMARRTGAHFESVANNRKPGNFGRIGVLDWLLSTACKEEPTVMDDFRDEAEKRRFQEHVEIAVHEALEGIDRKKKGGSQQVIKDADENEDEEDAEYVEKEEPEGSTQVDVIGRMGDKVANLVPRRSGRRKGR